MGLEDIRPPPHYWGPGRWQRPHFLIQQISVKHQLYSSQVYLVSTYHVPGSGRPSGDVNVTAWSKAWPR